MTVFFAKNRAKVKTYHFFAKKHPKMTKSYCKKSENVNFYALPIVKNTSFYTPFWPFTRKPIKVKPMSEANFRNRFVHLRGFWKARNCIFEILKISKNVNFPPPFLDVEICRKSAFQEWVLNKRFHSVFFAYHTLILLSFFGH